MGQLVALARDEIAGRGLFRRKAEPDRAALLVEQIEHWEKLRGKIADDNEDDNFVSFS